MTATFGDLLVRASALLAIGLFTLRTVSRRESAARLLSTGGSILLLVHVASAFHFHHGWSHREAYLHAARRTGEVSGFFWGGGLYVNYAFTLAWVFDTLWWWLRPDSHRRRGWTEVLWRAAFAFMTFNATVVFGRGVARWSGILFSLVLVLSILPNNRWSAFPDGESTEDGSAAG